MKLHAHAHTHTHFMHKHTHLLKHLPSSIFFLSWLILYHTHTHSHTHSHSHALQASILNTTPTFSIFFHPFFFLSISGCLKFSHHALSHCILFSFSLKLISFSPSFSFSGYVVLSYSFSVSLSFSSLLSLLSLNSFFLSLFVWPIF